MTRDEIAAELRRFSGLIDDGLRVLREQSHLLAQAENDYRRSKAQAWVHCPNDTAGTKLHDRDWTSARREAWVNAETADLRQARDLAEAMRQAALEAVRARRTQVSALQSLLAADRAEAEFTRTAP